jgi:hypothetical protein
MILAAALAVSPIVAAGGPGKKPKLGEKAPPFSLLDLDGQRVTLDGELTRGPVVLVLLRGCLDINAHSAHASSPLFWGTRQRSRPLGRASFGSILVRPTQCSNTRESSWRLEHCLRRSVSPLIPITSSRTPKDCVGMPRRKQRIPPLSSSIVARPSVSPRWASSTTAERLRPMF